VDKVTVAGHGASEGGNFRAVGAELEDVEATGSGLAIDGDDDVAE
jgi:hypothetical protein